MVDLKPCGTGTLLNEARAGTGCHESLILMSQDLLILSLKAQNTQAKLFPSSLSKACRSPALNGAFLEALLELADGFKAALEMKVSPRLPSIKLDELDHET